MAVTKQPRQGEALRLTGVTHQIGAVTAVEDLSLVVDEGEFVTLLGPSGCGKSTTLRIIAGYVRPKVGEVHIRGNVVTHLPPQLRDVGMVFQNYALFPHLDVARNIGFALSVRRRKRTEITHRIEEMLRLVQLEGLGNRKPSQLSGGQQQRVALARVLAFEPVLLLLDEPLSALDLKLREDMQNEIKRIQRELGITTIYVTHDQGEALHLSDRIAVMRAGRIEQVGPPDAVYRCPTTRFVASFLGKMQFLEARVLGFADNRQIVNLEGHDVRLACVTQRQLSSGERCLVGIRPEKVIVTEPEASTTRKWSIAGHIRERQYLGAHAQLTVLTATGASIVAIDHGERWVAGRQVRVSWDEADMTIFPGNDRSDHSHTKHTEHEQKLFKRASRT